MTIYKAHSDEWLAARNKVITGTEVASLFGLNKYKSAKSIMRAKQGIESDFEDNDAMRQGRRLEYGVLIATDELGYKTEPAAPWNHVEFIIHPSGVLGSSLDGIGYIKNKKVVVEAKTTRAANFDKWCDTNYPPIYYILQTHVEMMCLKTELGLLAVMPARIPFIELAIWGTIRDKSMDKLILDTCERFFINLNEGKEFKIDQKDKATITSKLEKSLRRIV